MEPPARPDPGATGAAAAAWRLPAGRRRPPAAAATSRRPPPGPNGNGGPNSPNGNGNGPARGGRTWTLRPFHPAQPGPREYTGGEDPIVPTGVFRPGERYDTDDAGDDAGFYTGGG